MAVWTERSEACTEMTKGQYSPVWLERGGEVGGGGNGGASHIKMTGVLVVPFQGQQAVLVPLGKFNLKRATA